jgi:predicted nucleotidyltransferase component of viral defense system
MNLNVLHRRLLQDVLEIGNDLPLVITGGYAVQAHQLVDRFSRDIDMATDSLMTMDAIVATVIGGLSERGWRVEVIGVDHHSARTMVTDPGSGEQCELDILRESFSRPPETTPYGPVLALDDVIGTKVRALAGRGLPRDLIDIRAASRLRTATELEALGRRHAWEDEFSLEDLKFRLDGADWYDDQAFAEYGLTEEEIADLRRWAQAWSDDINRRLYAQYSEPYADDDDEIS